MKLATIMLAALLSGCLPSGASNTPDTPEGWQRFLSRGAVFYVYPLTVDGVRCVAMTGASAASITCDWSAGR